MNPKGPTKIQDGYFMKGGFFNEATDPLSTKEEEREGLKSDPVAKRQSQHKPHGESVWF